MLNILALFVICGVSSEAQSFIIHSNSERLDSIILKVFSKLNDSMILIL